MLFILTYSFHQLLTSFSPLFTLVIRYNRDAVNDEENPIVHAFYLLMIAVSVIALLVMVVFIFRDIFQHVFKVPEFSALYTFNQKNLRLAYKVIGCHIVISDAGDRRGQYMFLISYLKTRFPKSGALNVKDIPNLHSYYRDRDQIFKWLHKHLNQEEKLQFIDFMVDLAFYNEKLSRREIRIIHNAGAYFGISEKEVKAILTMRYKFYQDKRRKEQEKNQKSRSIKRPSRSLKNEALKILGLSLSTRDLGDVKKAYREMAKKHHPDRFHNHSKTEQEKAHERFTAINKAYEYLNQILI
jgi:DnaJ-domain-containing protein 1